MTEEKSTLYKLTFNLNMNTMVHMYRNTHTHTYTPNKCSFKILIKMAKSYHLAK